MIVLDASAALVALLDDGAARSILAAEQVHVPELVDVEILSALRRRVRNEGLDADLAQRILGTWTQLGVTRHPHVGLVDRMWQLRDSVSAYDACYVALAERLGCTLVTADGRLGRAHGVHCTVTVVPG